MTWNRNVVTMSLTRGSQSLGQQTSASRLERRRREDTRSWEKDKYLSERSRAFLFGPPLEQFERLLRFGAAKNAGESLR